MYRKMIFLILLVVASYGEAVLYTKGPSDPVLVVSATKAWYATRISKLIETVDVVLVDTCTNLNGLTTHAPQGNPF